MTKVLLRDVGGVTIGGSCMATEAGERDFKMLHGWL